MVPKKRYDIYLSEYRISMLSKGQAVNMTQKGAKVRLIPNSFCCTHLQKFAKTHPKLNKTFSKCPYCGSDRYAELPKPKRTRKKKGEEHDSNRPEDLSV